MGQSQSCLIFLLLHLEKIRKYCSSSACNTSVKKELYSFLCDCLECLKSTHLFRNISELGTCPGSAFATRYEIKAHGRKYQFCFTKDHQLLIYLSKLRAISVKALQYRFKMKCSSCHSVIL